MFQTKRKLRDAVIELSYRVSELEERLCPMNSHDYQEIDHEVVSLTDGFDTDILYKYM